MRRGLPLLLALLLVPRTPSAQMTAHYAVDVRAFQVVRVVQPKADDEPVRAGSIVEQQTATLDKLITKLGTLVSYGGRPSRAALQQAVNEGHADLVAGLFPAGSLTGGKVVETKPWGDSDLVIVSAKGDVPKQLFVAKDHPYAAALSAAKKTATEVDDGDDEEVISRVGRGELAGAVTLMAHVKVHTAQRADVKVAATLATLPLVWGLTTQLDDLRADIDAYATQLRGTPAAPPKIAAPVPSDLDAVKARKSLRVGLANDGAGYFTHRGQEVGFHYDAAQALAKELDVRLEVVGADTATSLAALLDAQRVDAIVVPQSLAAKHRATSPITMSEDILLLLDQVELVVWATRLDAPQLNKAIDGWVKKQRDGAWMNALVDKYFPKQEPPVVEAPSPSAPSGTAVAKAISPYDAITQTYSKQYGFDWRFITAQMFHESRFNPKAKSWVGALGLMQVMPKTGAEMGFTALDDPDVGMHAGTKYMKQMVGRVAKDISADEKLNFALAAYNAGFGHVIDARKLTTELGLDANLWFGNTEEGLKLLEKKEYAAKARYGYCRAKETVTYVKRIRDTAAKYGAK